ncbi:MAG: helix-turn-helix transcriptional regulator [Myxococcales bacterium]
MKPRGNSGKEVVGFRAVPAREAPAREAPTRDRRASLVEKIFGKKPSPKNPKDVLAPVDAGQPSAVDTPAVGVPIRFHLGSGIVIGSRSPSAMEKEHFGNCLRRARESREISLSDVAQRTKVSRAVLEVLEKGDLDLLPAGVYSRGFIRSFARAVGTDETEPLQLYERAIEARTAAENAKFATPVPDAPPPLPHGQADDELSAPRRGLGLAVFVIILLLIATITLSLLLRRPPPSGEGLSWLAPRPPAVMGIMGIMGIMG